MQRLHCTSPIFSFRRCIIPRYNWVWKTAQLSFQWLCDGTDAFSFFTTSTDTVRSSRVTLTRPLYSCGRSYEQCPPTVITKASLKSPHGLSSSLPRPASHLPPLKNWKPTAATAYMKVERNRARSLRVRLTEHFRVFRENAPPIISFRAYSACMRNRELAYDATFPEEKKNAAARPSERNMLMPSVTAVSSSFLSPLHLELLLPMHCRVRSIAPPGSGVLTCDKTPP